MTYIGRRENMAIIRSIRGGSAKLGEEDRLQIATLLIKASVDLSVE